MEELDKLFDGKNIGEGSKVKDFEEAIGNFLGQINLATASFKVHTAAVNSGTAALHLAYILAGIQKDDEVITPVLTCTATNHPILWLGATPIFADLDPNTLNIDPADIERKITDRTKAIVVMHNGGHPCDMEKIMDIAKRYDLKVIEDCAQALGGEYNGQKLGTFGDFAIFSFQAIKQITTGDGGMVVCKNEEDIKRIKRLRWFAIDRDMKIGRDTLLPDKFNPFLQRAMTFDVIETGYKYHMNDIAATIGLANFEKIYELLTERKEYTKMYIAGLKNVSGIKLLNYDEDQANWLFTILVKDRKELQDFLAERGIETNLGQVRNDIYEVFGGEKQDLPGMKEVEDNYLALPMHNRLTKENVETVIENIKEFYA